MAFDWLRRLTGKDEVGDKDDAGRLARMIKLTHAGRVALAQGHAREALDLLSEKHKLVVAEWGKDAVFSATSAIDLADAFLAHGNTKEADRLLEWALDRYSQLGIDDARFLRALSTWAMSAYKAADYQRAEPRFIDLIKRYKAMGSDHDADRAMAMDHLAQVYLRQSRGTLAEPLLLEALAIFERDGSDPSATAVCLSLLARLRYNSGSYRETEQLQRRAIAIHESVNDEMNLAKELDHLGTTLAMRAQTEQRRDLAAEAVTYGERAVAIFEKHLPADHYSVMSSKQNLGRYKIMSASIGMMFPSGGERSDDHPPGVPAGHPFAITELLNRSWRLCEGHDYDGALGLAEDARKRAIQNFGDQSPFTGNAVAQIVGILRRHCSYLLGEPTGTLLPSESLMMQMRAHTRRGIVEDETTLAPKIETHRRAVLESRLEQAIAIAHEVAASAPDVGEARSAYIFRSEDFVSDVLEILHYARWLGVLENVAAARLAFEIVQQCGDVGVAHGLTVAGRETGKGTSRRALHEDYRLAVLERDTLVRSLVEAKDRATAISAANQLGQLPQLELKVAALLHQLQEDGRLDAQPRVTRLALGDAQSILLSNEAIIAIHIGRRAVFLIAVRPEGAAFKRVEMEGDLVRVMCEEVVKSATLSGREETPDFDLVNALQIHDLVFHPLRAFLETASHLLVLADGPLWTLPLGCLVSEPIGMASDDRPSTKGARLSQSNTDENDLKGDRGQHSDFMGRTQRLFGFRSWLDTQPGLDAVWAVSERRAWLADRYRISLMPSLAPLALRDRGVARTDKRQAFLGMGDPLIGRTSHSDHAAIPETRRILMDLAVAVGGDPVNDVLTGSAATIDRLIDLSESGELGALPSSLFRDPRHLSARRRRSLD